MSARGPIYEVRGPKLLGELTTAEVAAALEETRTVVLAAGSVEQHGPHLPLYSDWIQGEEFIRRTVAALADEGVTVLGGVSIMFAPAEDALSFPGTLSVSSATYEALVTDLLESLYGHGFRRFPIIVAHEQTMGPLMAATREFNARHGDAVSGVLTGWYFGGVRDLKAELCEGEQPALDGHAGEIESSRVIAARPELVQLERAGAFYPEARPPLAHSAYPLSGGGLYKPLHDYADAGPDGYVGDASRATREKGDRSFDAGVAWVCAAVKRDFVA
jgi:creatinine amidohydrolase